MTWTSLENFGLILRIFASFWEFLPHLAVNTKLSLDNIVTFYIAALPTELLTEPLNTNSQPVADDEDDEQRRDGLASVSIDDSMAGSTRRGSRGEWT